jgi:hypothetical protein
MTFKFKKARKPFDKISVPGFPQHQLPGEPEQLLGSVRGMTASAPEERLARALDKKGIQYEFRYVVGAPKGLPGWKELDFIASIGGLLYTMEVDTAFTHRSKEFADVLHDAIVLNDFDLNAMGEVFPHVIHVDGDTDLANLTNAEQFVRRQFGR